MAVYDPETKPRSLLSWFKDISSALCSFLAIVFCVAITMAGARYIQSFTDKKDRIAIEEAEAEVPVNFKLGNTWFRSKGRVPQILYFVNDNKPAISALIGTAAINHPRWKLPSVIEDQE